jgi:hypothetical protein
MVLESSDLLRSPDEGGSCPGSFLKPLIFPRRLPVHSDPGHGEPRFYRLGGSQEAEAACVRYRPGSKGTDTPSNGRQRRASKYIDMKDKNGGEGGIRTHGAREGTHALQACTFDHSVTSPLRVRGNGARPVRMSRTLGRTGVERWSRAPWCACRAVGPGSRRLRTICSP